MSLLEKVMVGQGLEETIRILAEIEQRAWVIFRKECPLVYRSYSFGGINEDNVFFYRDSTLGQTLYKIVPLKEVLCH